MENNKFNNARAFSFNESISYSDGGIVSMRVLEKSAGNVSLFAFDKGQKLSEHTAPFDAMIQVTEGEAEIVIGGIINQLTAGQTIIMPANVPHAVNATSRFKMVLTMIKA
ncbi:MAG: cupin domain-containing protein [Lentimicrobium sp.]|jgi:quercetin dioxygenase-like cupin family protein|uniref:cupin domain-containing protein n=1 Tax=Lentimicrobium sp. TaxID=2034841 RepID=UPI0025D6965F|nr:cupin domain-containing protein [Lentimicrobium sp.]MCO5256089.1 cupin domain-containing protein [Lentimicrobium sp.]MCO5262702.1 cupin domain-containing protein [Lentimicrobium sp.]HPF65649.1 cupin domain-containing protein [Lentimicrobium sp.]